MLRESVWRLVVVNIANFQVPEMRRIGRIHFVGIGGSGMCGIAEVLLNQGYEISGSDIAINASVNRLIKAGAQVFKGHKKSHIDGADVVVKSSAVTFENIEIATAIANGIPVVRRAEMLAELMRYRHGIAVAGTHGKTTTSAMAAFILDHNGHTPGFLIGGVPGNFPVSARLGAGPWFVIEADEYDTAFFDKRSKFVHYRPQVLVLGNLEFDHADIFDSISDIEKQFEYLLRTVPAQGTIVVNADHPVLETLLERGCWSQIVRYSICGAETAQWQATPHQTDCRHFDVSRHGQHLATVEWNIIGRHNMANALAAIAASDAAGVDPVQACAALAEFRLPQRRLERVNPGDAIALFDDFAHHPTAVRETLQALRSKNTPGQLIAVLELRSNTMKRGVHRDALGKALALADVAVVRRRADLDWDPAELALDPDRTTLMVCDTLTQIVDTISDKAKPGDQIVMMSNGNFDGLKEMLQAQLV